MNQATTLAFARPTINAAFPPRVADSPSDAQPAALSRREASGFLGISERTLWTLTKAQSVPHLRIGSRVLYRRAALEAWLASREIGVALAT